MIMIMMVMHGDTVNVNIVDIVDDGGPELIYVSIYLFLRIF